MAFDSSCIIGFPLFIIHGTSTGSAGRRVGHGGSQASVGDSMIVKMSFRTPIKGRSFYTVMEIFIYI